jgi:hypothetical protein
MEGGSDQPVAVKLTDIDEEAVHAVVPLFRSLYVPTEPTSYRRTLNLLKRHVHESPRREAAIGALKDLGRWERDSLNNNAMSIVRNNVRMTADHIIKLYLNGQYLHKDRELHDQLDAFLMPEVLRAEFLRAIRLLGSVYWIGRNVVAAVLETPSLVPAVSVSAAA